MVRAKFKVANILQRDWGTEVSMFPVYSEDPNSENKKFWDATPCGSLVMSIKNEAAGEYFERDKEYYIDFTAVEP
jgi:hypothetical protein